jgi:hypothetical protein
MGLPVLRSIKLSFPNDFLALLGLLHLITSGIFAGFFFGFGFGFGFGCERPFCLTPPVVLTNFVLVPSFLPNDDLAGVFFGFLVNLSLVYTFTALPVGSFWKRVFGSISATFALLDGVVFDTSSFNARVEDRSKKGLLNCV